jgi:hypothetical protein
MSAWLAVSAYTHTSALSASAAVVESVMRRARRQASFSAWLAHRMYSRVLPAQGLGVVARFVAGGLDQFSEGHTNSEAFT